MIKSENILSVVVFSILLMQLIKKHSFQNKPITKKNNVLSNQALEQLAAFASIKKRSIH